MEKMYQSRNKSELRYDGGDKATGAAKYTSDILFPDMLIAKLVRCPHAHARIKAIDKEKAMIAGVKAIFTYHDVPQTRFSTAGYPKETIRSVAPYVPMEYLEDKLLLDQVIHHRGEPAAVVVGESEAAVDEAVRLLEVEYEVLPHAITIEDALKPDAPDIHPGTRKNVLDAQMRKGDIEQGFAEADFIFEDHYTTPQQQHCCMEPSCSVARKDPSGKITLWSTTQVPFHIRRDISEVLDIPMSRIRVIKPYLGGGFGERQMVQNEVLCAFVASHFNRPVRLAMTREENMEFGCHRHQAQIDLKTGVRKDGRIVAFQVHVRTNGGAYTGHSPYVTKAMCTKNPYDIENILFDSEVVYTNLSEAGAYRGYGNPQISFARECHFDRIAEALKMDNIAFRKRNMVQVGQPNPVALNSDWILESCELAACLDQGAEAIDWYAPRRPAKDGKAYGKGLCAALHVTGTSACPDFSSATVTMNEDGSVQLLLGSPDLGQGSDTAHSQICADTLGVHFEDVHIISADTDVTSLDMGSYASRQTYVAGNAVKLASEKVKARLLDYASAMTGQLVGNLDTDDGWIVRRENGRRLFSIKEVAYYAMYVSPKPLYLCETASYSSLNCPPAFAAHFAEVEVDTETGEVKLLNFVAAHDVGYAINPKLVEGQVEGCVCQGLGLTLFEDMHYDEKGRLRNPNFTDYKVPRALDMPPVRTIIVDSYEPSGPFGAKSVGEMAVAPVPAAIANAIYDAVGVRIHSLPITKEKLRKALQEKAGASY